MKVWIVKYALSSGIIKMDLKDDDNINDSRIYVKLPGALYATGFSASEYAFSQQTAFEKAEEMRVKKITALENQINKLKAKRFK